MIDAAAILGRLDRLEEQNRRLLDLVETLVGSNVQKSTTVPQVSASSPAARLLALVKTDPKAADAELKRLSREHGARKRKKPARHEAAV